MSFSFSPDHLSISYANQQAHRAALADVDYLSQHGDGAWHVNDSTWAEYSCGINFSGLNKGLDEVVANLRSDSEVGLDIAGGSNGTAMLDLIHRGILNHAAVTNFEDRRSEATKCENRLDHISGNLLSPLTWQKIFEWQRDVSPGGLKLITHEPRNTLQWLKPELYSAAAHTLVGMLASGGALISQVPKSLSRRERNTLCRSLQQRADVVASSTSRKHSGYHQALLVKA
jgi:hypothetical protein